MTADRQVSCAVDVAAPQDSASVVTRYLARQPILDLRGRVVAYELLFRSAAESAFSGMGDLASQTMIDNTMICGLGRLTTGRPAFINCTAHTLFSEYIHMLPVPLTILEILEDVEVNEEVVRACTALRRKGYRIALDDFDYRPSLEPLIRIADYIKIDFRITPAAERRRLIPRLRAFQGTFVAEKVETREEFQEAKQEGFRLFQGFYFCRPTLLKKHVVPSNRLAHFRLLTRLHEVPLNVAEVSELVKAEPSIAYRLLRYVNSAGNAIPQEITSIRTALVLVGDDLFRRLAMLAVAVELNAGQSPELLRMALVRARFCETAAPLRDLKPTEQYLAGLFSLLDAMLQIPMEEALSPLPLSAAVRAALLGADTVGRRAIRWLEHHERGDFAQCDEVAAEGGFAPELLEQHFNAAMQWSDELLAQE